MRSNHDDIAQALQSCLEMVRSGQESVSTAMAHYPEFMDVLKPQLETALWLRERSSLFAPRAGYVLSSENRVVTRIRRETSLVGQTSASHTAKLPIWSKEFWQRKLAVQAVLTLLLVVSLLIGSSGVAKASQQALPGDSLYPVKILLENVTLSLASNPAASAELHIRYAQRRLTEIQSLVAVKRYAQISQAVTDFTKQLDQAIKGINLVAAYDKIRGQSLATSLKLALSSHIERITLLEDIIPQQAKPDFEIILHASEGGIAAAQAVLSDGGSQSAGWSTPAGASAIPSITPEATPLPSGTATSTVDVTAMPVTPAGVISGVPTDTLTPNPDPSGSDHIQTVTPSPTSTEDDNKKPAHERKPTRTPKPKENPKPTHESKPADEHKQAKLP